MCSSQGPWGGGQLRAWQSRLSKDEVSGVCVSGQEGAAASTFGLAGRQPRREAHPTLSVGELPSGKAS